MRCWLSDMAAWVNTIGRKVSVTSANQAGGSGGVLRSQLQFQGILRKMNYELKYTYILLKLRVKQVIYE